jgi:hypothetical protein
MGRTTKLSVRVPDALLERARVDGAKCGVSLRAFVAETTHAALAERCCRHAPPSPAAPEDEDEEP